LLVSIRVVLLVSIRVVLLVSIRVVLFRTVFTGTYASVMNVRVADGQDSVVTNKLIITIAISYHKIRNLMPTTYIAFGTSNGSARSFGPFGPLSISSV